MIVSSIEYWYSKLLQMVYNKKRPALCYQVVFQLHTCRNKCLVFVNHFIMNRHFRTSEFFTVFVTLLESRVLFMCALDGLNRNWPCFCARNESWSSRCETYNEKVPGQQAHARVVLSWNGGKFKRKSARIAGSCAVLFWAGMAVRYGYLVQNLNIKVDEQAECVEQI